MPKDDGGLAFPYQFVFSSDDRAEYHNGMSLRDWFASTATDKDVEAYLYTAITRAAARYMHADAMLAASKRN